MTVKRVGRTPSLKVASVICEMVPGSGFVPSLHAERVREKIAVDGARDDQAVRGHLALRVVLRHDRDAHARRRVIEAREGSLLDGARVPQAREHGAVEIRDVFGVGAGSKLHLLHRRDLRFEVGDLGVDGGELRRRDLRRVEGVLHVEGEGGALVGRESARRSPARRRSRGTTAPGSRTPKGTRS